MATWHWATMLCLGCGEAMLAPGSVASPWVAESLDKQPDVVVSVDVAAMRRDPFFGRLASLIMDGAPLPYDAILGATQVDLFGTAQRAFTAVVYGAGDLTPDIERCIVRDADREKLTVAQRGGRWIISNAKASTSVPEAVAMDRRAIFEAWVGPGAIDVALDKWGTPKMWDHLHAMRLRIEGGAAPGILVDARFETSVDAEHAQYDLARLTRELQRMAGSGDPELSRLLLEQLPSVHVARSGVDVEVEYHLTASFTDYVSRLMDRENKHRTRHGCGE